MDVMVSEKSLLREIPGLLLTGSRLLLADRIAKKIKSDRPVALDLAGFVAADIADGEILRKFNADTPIRRVADGVVDHASMIQVGYETAKKYPV